MGGRELASNRRTITQSHALLQSRATMSSTNEKRKSDRIEFSSGIDVHMVAIDGTWRRACVMLDVSASGAKLSVTGSLKGLSLKEFFLVLSTTGQAFRRC
jgi:hypothetical protein